MKLSQHDHNLKLLTPTEVQPCPQPSMSCVTLLLQQYKHSWTRLATHSERCIRRSLLPILVKLQSSIAANLVRSSRQRMEQKQGGAPCQATAAAIWLPTSSRRMAGQRQDSTHLGAPGAALASAGAAAFHITAPARFKVVDEHSHTAEFQSLRCQSLTMNAKITPNT